LPYLKKLVRPGLFGFKACPAWAPKQAKNMVKIALEIFSNYITTTTMSCPIRIKKLGEL